MSRLIILVVLVIAAFGSGQLVSLGQPNVEKVETRCGWFSNPTPANASLYDSQREWIISVQGGYEAEGDWPDIPPKEWVETNGHYGYGWACMRVTEGRDEGNGIKIVSSTALPSPPCR